MNVIPRRVAFFTLLRIMPKPSDVIFLIKQLAILKCFVVFPIYIPYVPYSPSISQSEIIKGFSGVPFPEETPFASIKFSSPSMNIGL
ncbi:MAG: hypothetical protein QW620_02220 [Thermoplasmata archaeon]